MTDRELLELAGKALKLNLYKADSNDGGGFYLYKDTPSGNKELTAWNPLIDDGDALRLAVKLKLHMLHNDNRDAVLWVSAVLDKTMIHGVVEFVDETDRQAATRRAITRAAAEIGKAMP